MRHRRNQRHSSYGSRALLGAGVPRALALLAALAALLATGCPGDAGAPGPGATTTTAPAATTTAPPAPGTTTTTGGAPTTATTSGGLGPGSGVVTEAKRLSPDSGPFVICQDCHTYLDPPGDPPRALDDAFDHGRHLARSATCEACHSTPVHAETTTRRPTMAACYSCHGEGPESVAPAECDLCHPPDFERLPASHDDAFYGGAHAAAAEASGEAECFVCHQEGATGFCRACHGMDMPHPTGWALAPEGGPGAHVDAAHEDGAVCVRCHQNRGRAPAGCYGGECHGA